MFFLFKQKTAYEMRISDWSSDVCSSDLPQGNFRADGKELLVGGDVFPEVAEVLGGEGMAVRPAMPLAQLQGETAAVLDLQPLQDVRHDLERLVVGHQARVAVDVQKAHRSEEHTSELQSLMRISYAVFCLNKKIKKK